MEAKLVAGLEARNDEVEAEFCEVQEYSNVIYESRNEYERRLRRRRLQKSRGGSRE